MTMFSGFPRSKPDGKFLSPIKSIQRGTHSIDGDGSITTSVNISKVDPNKAVVIINTKTNSSTPDSDNYVRAVLNSDGTAIDISRFSGSTATVNVNWQVIEFNNVKSLQRGFTTIAAANLNVTISAVNVNKAIIIDCGGYSQNPTANIYISMVSLFLTNSTTLTVSRIDAGATISGIAWQVIEFY